jgi:hypothetical protein
MELSEKNNNLTLFLFHRTRFVFENRLLTVSGKQHHAHRQEHQYSSVNEIQILSGLLLQNTSNNAYK